MNLKTAQYQLLLNVQQNVAYGFEPWFFNTEKYLNFWQSGDRQSFYWFNVETQQVDALLILLYDNDGGWHSPLRGTFAGIDAIEGLDIQAFVLALRIEFEALKLENIHIKLAPQYGFDNYFEVLKHNFESLNIRFIELNYHLPITQLLFSKLIHTSKKWRLNKLLKSNYQFEEYKNFNVTEIYDFIYNARIRKSFPVTMTLQDFALMFHTFSDKYLVFRVLKNKSVAALSVCVNIGKGVLYNFYSADSELYLSDSPMILLNKGMYEYAQLHHYKILDIGISTYLGERNEGLIHFKKSIGAVESLKPVIRL